MKKVNVKPLRKQLDNLPHADRDKISIRTAPNVGALQKVDL